MKFPVIAKLKKTEDTPKAFGVIVSFTSAKEGIVIHGGINNYYEIGHISNDWCSVSNIDCWEILSDN